MGKWKDFEIRRSDFPPLTGCDHDRWLDLSELSSPSLESRDGFSNHIPWQAWGSLPRITHGVERRKTKANGKLLGPTIPRFRIPWLLPPKVNY